MSTYYSDPAARWRVDGHGPGWGAGILGYYTAETAAARVCAAVRKDGGTAQVLSHDPKAPVAGGVHPLVQAQLKGFV